MLNQSERMSLGQALRRTISDSRISAVANFAATLLASFICARCTVFGGIQAASAALFAAGMGAGMNSLAMLLGCVLGCASMRGMMYIWPAFACLCVWLTLCVLKSVDISLVPTESWIKNRFRAICRVARRDTESMPFRLLAAIAAGMANMLMCISRVTDGFAGVIYCTVSALVGFGLTPVFCVGLGTMKRYAFTSRLESCAAALLAALCCCGLRGYSYGYLMMQPACAIGMLALILRKQPESAKTGANVSWGAAFGAIFGLCAWLTGANPLEGVLYLLIGAALGWLSGNALAILAIGGLGVAFAWISGANVAQWALSAGLGGILNFKRARHNRRGNGGKSSAEDFYSRCLEAERARREQDIARLTQDLYDIMGIEAPRTYARELELLKSRMCKDCDKYQACWNHAAQSSRESFVRLYDEIKNSGEVRPELLPRGCSRVFQARDVLMKTKHGVEFERNCTRLANERRATLIDGMNQARSEIEKRPGDSRAGSFVDTKASHEIVRRLRAQGIACMAACVTVSQPRVAYIEIVGMDSEPASAPNGVLRALMAATNERFELIYSENGVLKLRQEADMGVKGSMRRTAITGCKCGDSGVINRLPDGRWLAAISDGMGRGEAAAHESYAALAAINRLLSEGVSPENAIELANSMLQLSSDGEMYATLDVAVIDAREGRADFYKLGAIPSLLVSGENVKTITACAPPFGILEHVSAAHRLVKLHAGDRLMLLSDGVCDFSDEKQARALVNLAHKMAAQRPDLATERIISEMRSRFSIGDDAALIVLDMIPTDGAPFKRRAGRKNASRN